jgi:hypothetical protein
LSLWLQDGVDQYRDRPDDAGQYLADLLPVPSHRGHSGFTARRLGSLLRELRRPSRGLPIATATPLAAARHANLRGFPSRDFPARGAGRVSPIRSRLASDQRAPGGLQQRFRLLGVYFLAQRMKPRLQYNCGRLTRVCDWRYARGEVDQQSSPKRRGGIRRHWPHRPRRTRAHGRPRRLPRTSISRLQRTRGVGREALAEGAAPADSRTDVETRRMLAGIEFARRNCREL